MTQTNDNAIVFEILQSFFSERDANKLCELVLRRAMDITQADGGSLYLINPERSQQLDFSIVINESLKIYKGGTLGAEINYAPIQLLDPETSKKNHRHIASHAALTHELLNIEDAYKNTDFDFTGMKSFDQKNNYRSKSFLVIPLLNQNSEIVGVLQLINAQDCDSGQVISFSSEHESLLSTLANFSALALENALLAREKNEVLINLLAEQDVELLLENVLKEAMKISRADSGSLYMLEGEGQESFLKFTHLLSATRESFNGIKPEEKYTTQFPLFDKNESPNNQLVICCSANEKRIVNVKNIHQSEEFDSYWAKKFEEKETYHTQSLLAIPLFNHENDVIGVIQLINAKEPASGEIIPFSKDIEPVISALTQYAAIVVNLQILLEDHRLLLDSFVKCIAGAIDKKSPHTSAHCQRIPVIMDLMVDAICKDKKSFLNFNLNEEERHEIQVASWLHDCGKLTTPDSILEKSTKLHKMHDVIAEVNTRFQVKKHQLELNYYAKIEEHPEQKDTLKMNLARDLKLLESDRLFIEKSNIGSEFMRTQDQERVRKISKMTWVNSQDQLEQLLSDDEVYNLCIEKGTINPKERDLINNHMQVTIDMLNSLHFPRTLNRVPEIAGGHHEKMNGQGFPKGLRGDQLSIPARMMAIADIFEALTAQDRPYKEPMKISQALGIMHKMTRDQHIDPELFALFIEHKVWLNYAESYLTPEQLDIKDASNYLH